ncbi:MAG TPA: DNA mismatch repair endonuclease MutL [Pirellulales bacterium]|jgi:DNA mismatch repair protein MutL|nr:DNA mismatch repair endonuclease MutL [Pirellulales bacterium]
MSVACETRNSVIRQLSPGVVNKIAAGEVIERPASVVKELLENAIDAGATRIDVAVEQGGVELVRVVDNGCGIAADELPLAVASHATSKIREADDLFRVGTLGFRGEALASIAEVSRLVLRSRTPDAAAGAELEVVGGERGAITPCGAAPGTTVEVRNLFFNTPVRRKFLRATQTEMGHTTEGFTRLALAYPQVHLTLRHSGKTVYDLPPTESLTTRIAGFFGEELARELLWVESHDGPLRLFGYVARPSQSRGNARMQYLFLNGRAIRDRSLQHALGEAYRGLLLTGRYPICFLQIVMPPEEVDVNVHPTKLEVRFQDGGRLYSQLLGTLRTKFLTVDLNAKLQPSVASDNEAAAAHDPQAAQSMRQRLVAWAKGELSRQTPMPANDQSAQPFADEPFAVARLAGAAEPLSVVKLDRPRDAAWPTHPSGQPGANWDTPRTARIPVDIDGDSAGPPTTPAVRPSQTVSGWQSLATADRPFPSDNLRPAAIQVHNRYLIAETDEGMVIIDQHALHERILYEQIRAKVLGGALESQRLLVPEPVDLGPAESAAVLSAAEKLARLGVQVEPFGGGTVLITSYPAMLANFRPVEVLRELVDKLLTEAKQPDRRDMLDELLHMISCKAAIKAGDRLSTEEIAALVEQRDQYADSHHCPHGRPTSLVFTREELDRQFMRT